MKKNFPPHRLRASTMTDVLIVVVMIVLLTIVFLLIVNPANLARRDQCASNLQRIGLGFFQWASDNGDDLPWETSTNGGTLEFVGTTNVFLHFQAASNDLASPRILVCPSDRGKTAASNFNQLADRNISYFIGLDSDILNPLLIMSGDRNLATNGVALGSGVFSLNTNNAVGWTPAIHNNAGNIGFPDGSSQQLTPQGLQVQWLAATNAIRRLAIP